MVQKKKAKVKKVVRQTKAVKEKEVVREKQLGFFQRTKDILSQEQSPQKTVHVKTFIVEKPIIIHEKPQHINLNSDDEEVTISDDRKKYKKKFRGVDLEETPESADDESEGTQGLGEEGDFANEGTLLGDVEGTEDELGEPGVGEEGVNEEGGVDNLEQQIKSRHVRSRAMIVNVWWKKAILWGFLVWLLILILELGMQAIKLVSVDLTRQWWILLAGILVVALIYFGVIESRVKF